MKKMTCKELGGACELEFYGSSFEELAEKSKAHGLEMMQKGDLLHLEAMEKMKEIMRSPDGITVWMDNLKKKFDDLPNCD